MGEVFRAYDAVLAREVAIKVLHRNLASDPGFVDRFRREARSAGGLSHPNIVAVHDWGAVDGIYFMVMEYVRGMSVREILNERGFLAPAQAADLLVQALAALDHAHRRGIVHRDVKPENLLVTHEGVVKVADFGLARAYADSRVTQVGTVAGTVQYLAPEQLQGEPADPRTDLYSLGIVGFELLTGRVPFSGETQVAIAVKHVRDRVPRPSSVNPAVPAGLDAWVASMTEKDRELRPESASEARRDLASEARHLPPAPPIAELVHRAPELAPAGDPDRAPTVVLSRRPRGRRGRRGRWILGALVALLALSAAAWGAWTYLIPHTVDVPNVLGMDVRTASARLNDAGLTARIAAGRYSMRFDKDAVMRLEPAAGSSVRTGSVVTLVPSLGPPPVPVPDLTHLTVEDAAVALRKAHLALGPRHDVYSAAIRAGEIVRQDPQAAAEAPRGSAVEVWVSKGPRPEPVPKVIGKTQVEAEGLLGAWVLKVETRFSDTVPKGEVIDQRPAPKAMLQPGQTVTIFVSLGPRTFPMPDVVGMSKDAAIARLKDLGLRVAVSPLPGSPGTTVAGQLPLPGQTVTYGQTVTIYV